MVDELHQLLEIMYAAAEWETLRDAEAFPSIVFLPESASLHADLNPISGR